MADKQGPTAEQERVSFGELGTTGLSRWGGQISEGYVKELQGAKGRKIYRQMSETDPVVGASLLVLELIMRTGIWNVETHGEEAVDEAAAEFVRTWMDDMSHSWASFVMECCSFFTYGWSAFEHVWKKREGMQAEVPSKYADGLIAPRKLAIRGQSSLSRWDFDPTGGLQGMWQYKPDYSEVLIPIQKVLLFRTREDRGNPEGVSILRNVYRPWFFKKNVEEVEGVGIERDLTGLPVMYVPVEIMTEPSKSSLLASCTKIVTNIRRDEQEGIVMPRDVNHPDAYELKLMTSGGSRQLNTTEIINRHTAHMMIALLTDFLLIGHEGSGSYALIESKQATAQTAVMGYLGGIKGVLNRFLIPKSIELNAQQFPGLTAYPYLEVSIPRVPTPTEIMLAIDTLAKAGADLFPNLGLMNRVLQEVGLPPITEMEALEAEAQMTANEAAAQAGAQQVQRAASGFRKYRAQGIF